jgi:hypothetical protein
VLVFLLFFSVMAGVFVVVRVRKHRSSHPPFPKWGSGSDFFAGVWSDQVEFCGLYHKGALPVKRVGR